MLSVNIVDTVSEFQNFEKIPIYILSPNDIIN